MDADILEGAGFVENTAERWRALAERALKGAAFEDALVSRTDEGIAFGPVHRRRATDSAPLARQDPLAPWRIVQRIDDVDTARAAAQALEDVEGGATGVCLVFEGAPTAYGYGLKANAETLLAVLERLPLERLHVRIDANPRSRSSAEWMLAALQKRKADAKSLNLNFGIDPAAIFGGTGRLRMSVEALKASMPQSLAGFFSLNVPGVLLEADSRPYHNAGATVSQELGAMISTAVTHLRMFAEARQPLVYAVPLIGFALSADQDFFASIAKIRALRLLWARAQKVSGVEPGHSHVHAETSLRMMTLKDPETNILRSTVATFAAGVGGADSVCVLPHTIAHGLPDAFARRVARNTQLIAIGEAHLDHVADPAAGSGAIEHLTEQYCEAGWAEFQAIEAEGGILDSLLKGAFQKRVEAAHRARIAELAKGRRQIVGTTLHPAADERPVSVLDAERKALPEEGSEKCDIMPVRRIDEFAGTHA